MIERTEEQRRQLIEGESVAVDPETKEVYVVVCKDGSRYRVFVNAEGRVVVQKQ